MFPLLRQVLVGLVALLSIGMSRAPACTICDLDIGNPDLEFTLPPSLEEVSGLVRLNDWTLLAHDDERGIIYQIDMMHGSVTEWARLRDARGVVQADFEAILKDGSDILLVTSDGLLLRVKEDASYTVTDTGLGGVCELEGAATDAASRLVYLACKAVYDDAYDVGALIFRWSLNTNSIIDPPISVSKKTMKQRSGGKRFRASGIDIDPVNRHLILVSAQDQVILEITLDGDIVAARSLPEDLHPQTEGVGFLLGGALVLADEGRKTGGTIAVYKTHR